MNVPVGSLENRYTVSVLFFFLIIKAQELHDVQSLL